MEEKTNGLYLSRILAGYYIFTYGDNRYKLIYPNMDTKYEAELLIEEESSKSRFNDWIKEEEILNLLVELEICGYDIDFQIEKTEKEIDDIKVDLYKNYLDPKIVKSIKKNLRKSKAYYDHLYSKRHMFDEMTETGYCNKIRNEFIMSRSIYDLNGERVFSGEYNSVFLNRMSSHVAMQAIDIPTFKKIARGDVWKNYWGSNESNLFGRPVIDWTDEQRTLVVITKMYESAHSHPECPPDSVFEDDDMFDGWMISERRKYEQERAKSRAEQTLSGKLGKANEVFVMAKSKEAANNIYALNDGQGKGIINERQKALSAAKVLDDRHLPDVQRNINMMNNEIMKQNVRKQ